MLCTSTSKTSYNFGGVELDCLKQASVNSNRLWVAAGKPLYGPIFNDRQSCRMVYRKRLRDEERNETTSYTNEHRNALMQKNGPVIWKCWKSKFTNPGRCVEVDGCTDSVVIADKFSNYFPVMTARRLKT